jgi:hypothetical protein
MKNLVAAIMIMMSVSGFAQNYVIVPGMDTVEIGFEYTTYGLDTTKESFLEVIAEAVLVFNANSVAAYDPELYEGVLIDFFDLDETYRQIMEYGKSLSAYTLFRDDDIRVDAYLFLYDDAFEFVVEAVVIE